MARFDVDGSPVSYIPSSSNWVDPTRLRNGVSGSTVPIYQQHRLNFESSGPLVPAAAYEEWVAFDNGAAHSIVLPPPGDVLGGDVTYAGVYIEIERRPRYDSAQVTPFTVIVWGLDVTTT